MDALERSYLDAFESTFEAIKVELAGIRSALDRIAVALQPKQEAPKPALDTQLALPITALNVSTRAESALISNRCKTIGDVANLTRNKLNLTWHCGSKTIKEIETALARRNLKLSA